jgi:ABC-type multidrug transport system fused ATPase/permease subunit
MGVRSIELLNDIVVKKMKPAQTFYNTGVEIVTREKRRPVPQAVGAGEGTRAAPGAHPVRDGALPAEADDRIVTAASAPAPATAATAPAPLVEMHRISKRFGAVQALRDADLTLFPGEVLGPASDNAAGKSILMKILTGVYQPDGGEILFDGHPVRFNSPAAARARGINLSLPYSLAGATPVRRGTVVFHPAMDRWYPARSESEARRGGDRKVRYLTTSTLFMPAS